MFKIVQRCFIVLSCFVWGCGSSPDISDRLNCVVAQGTLFANNMKTSGLKLLLIPENKGAKTTNAWAIVGEGGQFRISTYAPSGDGAPVGKYNVYVTGGEGPMPEDDPRYSKIPAKYRDHSQSGWEIEIREDPAQNQFALTLP